MIFVLIMSMIDTHKGGCAIATLEFDSEKKANEAGREWLSAMSVNAPLGAVITVTTVVKK